MNNRRPRASKNAAQTPSSRDEDHKNPPEHDIIGDGLDLVQQVAFGLSLLVVSATIVNQPSLVGGSGLYAIGVGFATILLSFAFLFCAAARFWHRSLKAKRQRDRILPALAVALALTVLILAAVVVAAQFADRSTKQPKAQPTTCPAAPAPATSTTPGPASPTSSR